MRSLCHTQAIFRQLAQADGPAQANVKNTIENHDAWLHNAEVQVAVSAAICAQFARQQRSEAVSQRIRQQRDNLATLVTRLPSRLLSAG